jgi:predicted nucleic acid-binding protein
LIVADSSYVVEGLLSGGALFANDRTLVPDLAVHEVANALFVQQRVLKKIPDGTPFIELLFEAIDSGLIRVVAISGSLISMAYEIAARYDAALYDCVFVAVALTTGLGLKTRDERQRKVYEAELGRRRDSTTG